MKSALSRTLAIACLIITLATACIYADLPYSDPTPTPPPPKPTLPSPMAHLIPSQCQIPEHILPNGFAHHYWGTIIRNEEPSINRITVTNLKLSQTDHQDIDWHNADVQILAPWGTTPIQGHPDNLPHPYTTTVTFAPGSFVKVITHTDHRIDSDTMEDPIPAIVVNQDNRIWNLELVLTGAADPHPDSLELAENAEQCLNAAAKPTQED